MQRFFVHFFSDTMLTNTARWLVVLCPVLLLLGVIGNELPCSLVAALFLLHSARSGDWQWLRQRWVQLALLLWGYIALRACFAEFPAPALALSLPWIRFPLFAAACSYWLLTTASSQRRLGMALVAGCGFLIADALFQYAMGHDIFGHARVEVTGYMRLTGPYAKPRVGMIMAWLLVPALGFLLAMLSQQPSLSRRRRIAAYAATAMLAIAGITAIYLSGERMAFLLTLMACGLFCLLYRPMWKWIPPLACTVFLLLYGINHYRPDVAARQIGASHQQISGYFQSPYGQILLSGLRMVQIHPLFGVGSGHFRLLCPRAEFGAPDAAPIETRCANHTHNLYSEWLVETGIIGLGLYCAILLQWIRIAWRRRAIFFADPLMISLVCDIALRLFPLAATPSQFVAWTAMPYWLIAGALLAKVATATNRQQN